MMDRPTGGRVALAAALERRDEWKRRPDTVPMYSVVIEAAARERLAQLPETCEHGSSEPHLVDDAKDWARNYAHCPGYSYPSALVERIRSLKLSIGLPRSDSEGFLYWQLTEEDAVAVLDALNRETP